MLNFTGQTKKRNVNLGDRGFGPKSKNYLEQAKLQRQKRENERQKERSGTTLQKYIRWYLELRRVGDGLAEEWENSDHLGSEEEWDSWIYRFAFLSKWQLAYAENDTVKRRVGLFQRRLVMNDAFEIKEFLLSSVVEGLILLIERFLRVESRFGLIEDVIDCFHYLLKKYDRRRSAHPQGILQLLSATLEHKEVKIPEAKIVNLAFEVNVNDSLTEFIHFLTVPSSLKSNDHHLALLRESLQNATIELSESKLVKLLVNFLKIHGESSFESADYKVLGLILSKAHMSLETEENDSDDEHENDAGDEDNIEGSSKIIHIDGSSLRQIESLYTHEFIETTIDKIIASEDPELSDAALSIFSALITLLPKSKSKLFMLITITPGAHRFFFNRLTENATYKEFEDCKNSKQDYIKPNVFNQIYSPNDQQDNSAFWKIIYTFEELYSYWMIVSNDIESFNDDKLNTKEVVKLCEFLRCLCLTLIFNSSKTQDIAFKNLKNISISLLQQLYMKNLRLKFLPSNFWEPHEINMNIDSILHIIGEEEERRLERGAESSDSEMEVDGPGFSSTRNFNINNEAQARLEILKKLPFFISFKDRVKVFQSLIELDKQRLNTDPFSMFQQPKLKADIRRENILEDAFDNLHNAGSTLKNQLQVVFYNEYGQEAGIDGGGITKEFLSSVVEEGFKTDLFKGTYDHQLYPNDEIYKKLTNGVDIAEQREKLLYLKFLGSIVGKCLFENILIDVSFAPFFLNKWCNNKIKNSINDLSYLDNELFSNMMKLTSMTPEELDELDLYFSVNEQLDKKNYVFSLAPNGDQIKVDSSNRLNYIHQLSNFKLNQSLHIQIKFFLEGLYEIISSTWLNMFDAFELQMLISGGESDVDIKDWKENVEYGGYFDDDITVLYFWEVVSEFTPSERSKLIKFVTSVSRAPLLGFGSLMPRFGIRNSGRDIERLPTASTCVNLLKLPDYQDKALIRKKLLYAINMDAGFDLS